MKLQINEILKKIDIPGPESKYWTQLDQRFKDKYQELQNMIEANKDGVFDEDIKLTDEKLSLLIYELHDFSSEDVEVISEEIVDTMPETKPEKEKDVEELPPEKKEELVKAEKVLEEPVKDINKENLPEKEENKNEESAEITSNAEKLEAIKCWEELADKENISHEEETEINDLAKRIDAYETLQKAEDEKKEIPGNIIPENTTNKAEKENIETEEKNNETVTEHNQSNENSEEMEKEKIDEQPEVEVKEVEQEEPEKPKGENIEPIVETENVLEQKFEKDYSALISYAETNNNIGPKKLREFGVPKDVWNEDSFEFEFQGILFKKTSPAQLLNKSWTIIKK